MAVFKCKTCGTTQTVPSADNEKKAKCNKRIAVIVAVLTALILTFVILLNTVIIPHNKYSDALALMDEGNYMKAIDIFKELDGYKDSSDKITECENNIFISMYGQECFDKFGIVEVGKYISFGKYEQDNNTSNGKEEIEWLVLDVVNGKALVVSKYGLDCQPYNTEAGELTWDTCTLRTWLNTNFINAAFSDNEKASIPTVTVSADKNTDYSTYFGSEPQDKIFLLSFTEANKYFSSDSKRECQATAYAKKQGAYTGDNGNCWWWLRSSGAPQNSAATVDCIGVVYEEGYLVTYPDNAVRPAFWIDLSLVK